MIIEKNSVMKKKYIGLVGLIILFAFTNWSNTGTIEFRLEVEPTSYASLEIPDHVDVKLPSKLDKIPVEQLSVILKSADDEFGMCNINCNQMDNKLSRAEKKDNWELLFDGKTLNGWHKFLGRDVTGPWVVKSGLLTGLGKESSKRGFLISDKQYENFILVFDWKISNDGNSGVFYHVVENPWSGEPPATAPEYQIMDELGRTREIKDLTKLGADYEMHAPNNERLVIKEAGKWNTSKIVFDNGHVEHWLNGEKILEFDAWTNDWFLRKQESVFVKARNSLEYGLSRRGHFSLQDHGDKVWFKNIKVKELPRKPKKTEMLFNGKDLSGWEIYGNEHWYVENGELIYESGPDKQYGYLGTRKYYNDFDLTLDFKQISDSNSGVFIRSVIPNDAMDERGQVEIAPPGKWPVGIYELKGRGWIIKPPFGKDNILKIGDWNTLRIRAKNDSMKIWLNNVEMVEIKDEMIGEVNQGRILLQIHSAGNNGDNIKIRWKDIIIREL